MTGMHFHHAGCGWLERIRTGRVLETQMHQRRAFRYSGLGIELGIMDINGAVEVVG